MIDNCEKFLNIMKDLELYLMEFEENESMKTKNYPDDCTGGGDICCPVIVITHNDYTFSTNDGIQKVWTQIRDIFLQPKRRSQGIMISNFLLPFGRLNLFSQSEKKKKVIEKARLIVTEAIKLFEYGKSSEGYWDGPKLHRQVVNKALPIAKALYLVYKFKLLSSMGGG